MLQGLDPGQPVWLTTAKGNIRCRVVESYKPRSGTSRIVLRVLEDVGSYQRGTLVVSTPLALRWRNVDHRKERTRSWLASLARLTHG